MRVLVVGSRGSKLALAQARQIVDALGRLDQGLSCRIEVIRTKGDSTTGVPLSEIGGTGVFVNEIEKSLLRWGIDVAVHSTKDLPTDADPDLHIAAYPEREDPRDALMSSSGGLDQLAEGSRVGTSSPRRRAQLLHARPDLGILDIRGNLDTRLRKLDEGDYDAIVVACAGLRRLGLESRITQALPTDICLPAAGQGALAVQCRLGDDVENLLRKLDHEPTRRCVEAEREVVRRVGVGCSTPIGVFARLTGGDIVVEAVLADPDGSRLVREKESGPASEAADLAVRLADKLPRSAALERS